MRVIVPFAPGHLHPRVLPALWSQGYEIETVECVNRVGDPHSYPNILIDLLTSDYDVTIVEHDVESRPGFLADLDACPEPWCFFAYHFRVPFDEALGHWGVTDEAGKCDFASLGHTKFKTEIVGPMLADLFANPLFGATWVARDSHICQALNDQGLRPHRHPGYAIHHHEYVDDDPLTMGDRS